MIEETRCNFDQRRSMSAVTRYALILMLNVVRHPRLSQR
jgi:hypothetical protein